MKKTYQKHYNAEPNREPNTTYAVGFGLVWQAIAERKIMVFSFLVLLITLPILYLVYRYQPKTEAAWMNDNLRSYFVGRTGGFFVEGNIHQKKSNGQKDSQNHYIGTNAPKVIHFSNCSSNLTVNNKNRIPTPRWNVNNKNSLIVFGVETVTPAKLVIKAAAEKLINNPEKALNQALEKNLGIKNSLVYKNLFVNKI